MEPLLKLISPGKEPSGIFFRYGQKSPTQTKKTPTIIICLFNLSFPYIFLLKLRTRVGRNYYFNAVLLNLSLPIN